MNCMLYAFLEQHREFLSLMKRLGMFTSYLIDVHLCKATKMREDGYRTAFSCIITK